MLERVQKSFTRILPRFEAIGYEESLDKLIFYGAKEPEA